MSDEPNAVAVRPDVPIDLSGFAPRNIDEAYRLGDGFAKAGFFPALKTGSQVLVAFQIAKDTGVAFTCIASNIMFVNGRLSLYGDALLGVAAASRRMEDFEEIPASEQNNLTATCRVKVKGIKTEVVRTFSLADAQTAKLWGKAGPWTLYPRRMLQMRARAWALRDASLTCGISSAEELRDIKAATVENPPALPEPAKQKWDALVTGGAIKEAVLVEKAAEVETPKVEPELEPGSVETKPAIPDWDSKGELPF